MSENMSKKQLVQSYMDNKDLFQVQGKVSRKALRGVYLGLMDMPKVHIQQLIDHETPIIIADKNNYKEVTDSKRTNGYFTPKSSKSGFFYGKRNTNKRGAITLNAHNRSSWSVRNTLRHEVGHALDWYNGTHRYASTSNRQFIQGTDNYMAIKSGTEPTRIVFENDRSFRRDHIPLYKRAGKLPDQDTLYTELAAELYSKYTALSSRYDPIQADNFMTANYLGAWQAFKTEIVPELDTEIKSAIKLEQERIAPKAASKEQATLMAYARLTKTLGQRNILNVGFDKDYNLKVKVPSHYSRKNFEALGIPAPHNNIQRETDGKHSILTIPRAHLPLSLKFNGAVQDSFGAKMQQKLSSFVRAVSNGFSHKQSLGA
jgi:hypothetical protein